MELLNMIELPVLTTLFINSTSLRSIDDFYISGMNRNSYVSDRFTYVDYYYFWRKGSGTWRRYDTSRYPYSTINSLDLPELTTLTFGEDALRQVDILTLSSILQVFL